MSFRAIGTQDRQVAALPARRRPVSTGGSKDLRIDMVAVRVTLLLDNFTIDGSIYVAPELRRFSDAWEALVRDQRSFIPVTDARIDRISDGGTFASPAFMQVKKSDIRGVFPLELPATGPSWPEAPSRR